MTHTVALHLLRRMRPSGGGGWGARRAAAAAALAVALWAPPVSADIAAVCGNDKTLVTSSYVEIVYCIVFMCAHFSLAFVGWTSLLQTWIPLKRVDLSNNRYEAGSARAGLWRRRRGRVRGGGALRV